MQKKIQILQNEIGKVLIGQKELVESMLIALFCDGNILIEGMPGVAKTTAVNTLAKALGVDFKRIQFTPDLLPGDILGGQIYDFKNGEFKIKKGSIFTNMLLADEINRAPAKVQSALLEVMQEKQVTIGEQTFVLEYPFFVMATQNPIEQEGTYKLPEAQLDRFIFKIFVDYNNKSQEMEMVKRVVNNETQDVQCVFSIDDLKRVKEDIQKIHMDDEILKYIIDIVDATRNPKNYNLNNIVNYIKYGASPRATISLYKASKAVAYLKGVDFVAPTSITAIAKNVLRHRIVLSYEAEANDITQDEIIDEIIKNIPIP
jgi:MoxR-like ATPase